VRMLRDRQDLARQWLVLAIAALAGSGALALGVALARVPSLAQHLTNTDLARRLLVVHVGLGVVIWFSALPVALFHLQRLAIGRAARAGRAAALAPWLSTAGMLALLTGLVPGLGRVHPVNYVPVVVHPLYVTGLLLFFAGVALSYLDVAAVGAGRRAPASTAGLSAGGCLPDVVAATLGSTGGLVTLGALYVLLALAGLGTAYVRVPDLLDEATRLEILMWGSGHLLQLANVAFVLVAWALLAAWGSGRQVGGRLRWVTLALVAPLVAVLVLLVRGPMWWFSRAGFVLLMQWALFPAVLLFLFLVLGPHFGRRQVGPQAPSRAALWPLAASVALMLVGFLYGALIRGSDLRIPGHYHACIGAVTLAYMALTLLLPGGSGAQDSPVALRRVAVLYGVGQLVFSTGLVLAGSYGLGRKAYGVEQQVANAGQWSGLWVMAAGGLMAFAGGAVWAVAALRGLRGPRPAGAGGA
jgi:cytochrome c oxidase subunit I